MCYTIQNVIYKLGVSLYDGEKKKKNKTMMY